MSDAGAGHAFISYVREDAERVDRLEALLTAAGIRVWRDTANLWPGQDWRGEIQGAITKDALVFIACFSDRSEVRPVSGQNEELVLALEQLRRRDLEIVRDRMPADVAALLLPRCETAISGVEKVAEGFPP